MSRTSFGPSDPDWRTGHCAEAAAARVAEATGRDVWAELGGVPRSWSEGAAVYRRLGVRSLAEAVTALLGPEIPRRRARRGDVVMVRGALGICAGEVADCMGTIFSMREVERAWSSKGRGGG